MECPYKTPLELKFSTLMSMWLIKDAEDNVVLFDLSEEQGIYIVQAINSHEKYKITCAKAYEGLCTNDLDACDAAIILLDKITKEAEKE